MDNTTEKKKIKLRLSLFDIIFISVALVIAVVILVFSSRMGNIRGLLQSGVQETVIFTVEFQGMVEGAGELIMPGDTLIDVVENRSIGTVVSVNVAPMTVSQKDYISGDFIISEVPGRTTATVVVSAQATVTENLISIGGYSIRVGRWISFDGPLYTGSGFVTDIERKD